MKEYNFKINGNDYTVGIEILNDNEADVVVNGASYSVEVLDATVKPSVVAKPQVAAVPASHPVQPSAVSVSKPSASASTPASAGESPLKSPLPGVILDIKVREGDTVAVGQTLVILEAMKMENNIDCDRAGVVKSIKVNRGDSVLEGDVLITLG
ncbi:biotin/lipoyl-containing protein [uncultured Alistipes sp.]|uniref:biotin/lipoyl-containing protein n=1 Tax=uncultured Alistipes sp. TaxID=538949 RepID=UPI0025F00FCE|nr:biotin/lipoyl-containing protein [uncultured Alistipes sp.]